MVYAIFPDTVFQGCLKYLSLIGRKSARPSSNVVSNDLRQQQRVCRPSTVKKCRRHRRRLFAIVIERRKRVRRVSNFHIDNWKRNKFSFFFFSFPPYRPFQMETNSVCLPVCQQIILYVVPEIEQIVW